MNRLLEAKFYQWIIFAIFLIVGYEKLGLVSVVNLFFGYLRQPNKGFTASFLMFYLFIPFYNCLIKAMNQRMHAWLIGICVVYFTLAPTMLMAVTVFHEPLWYAVIYFIAAYIRLYPMKWMENGKVCAALLACSVCLAYASVIVVDFVGVRFGFSDAYYMISDSHKLLALTTGVLAFLFFKNLNIGYSKAINTIASTTFGVLCIHASSDAMRTFLWKDLLKVASWYEASMYQLILFAVTAMVGIFAVCSFIDQMRIRLIEKPVFTFLSKFWWFHKELY